MIVVTGTLFARADAADEVLALSLEHVHRSRAEPGCISHAVHRDVENPLHFVFVERWSDLAALKTHFAVPASRAFGKAVHALSSQTGTLQIYETTEVQP